MASLVTRSLRRAATPSILRAVTLNRGMAAAAQTPPSAPKGKSLQQLWLSDKGAWPVIGVIGFAVVFSSSFLLYTLLAHPDVRINKSYRKTVIRPPVN